MRHALFWDTFGPNASKNVVTGKIRLSFLRKKITPCQFSPNNSETRLFTRLLCISVIFENFTTKTYNDLPPIVFLLLGFSITGFALKIIFMLILELTFITFIIYFILELCIFIIVFIQNLAKFFKNVLYILFRILSIFTFYYLVFFAIILLIFIFKIYYMFSGILSIYFIFHLHVQLVLKLMLTKI